MRYAGLQLQDNPVFKQFLIVSIMLHGSFLILVTIKSFLFTTNVTEIAESVRVDMVALPEKNIDEAKPAAEPEISEPKAVQAKPEPMPEAKPKDKPILPQKVDLKAKQKSAIDKLKAMAALESLKSEVEQKERDEKKANQSPAPTKGNIISSGSSFTGLSRLRVNDYLAQLIQKVRENWVIPQWLGNAQLKAEVIIVIDERGYIVKKEIFTSSGNPVFDSTCLNAVSDISPVDPPPSEVLNAQIMIRFPFQ